MNNIFNINNNNEKPDFLKASNLISELVNLEQQNRIQIDLIKKIIDMKYKNNAFINSVLIDLLSNEEKEKEKEKHEEITTKSSSRSTVNLEKIEQNHFALNAINNSTFNLHQNEFKLENEIGNFFYFSKN